MKRMVIPLILCLLLCVAAGWLTWQMYDRLQQTDMQAEQLQAQIEQVDAFLSSAPARQFVNNDAHNLLAIPYTSQREEDDALYSIEAPEGFVLKSYSSRWNEGKLERLYEELKRNKHGEEIYALAEVVIQPQEDEVALASHQNSDETNTIAIRFPALPEGLTFEIAREMGYITLYGGDSRTTIEQLAMSLSHEYGHHFTFYHMLEWGVMADSEYASIRDLPSDKVVFEPGSYTEYIDRYDWTLHEIAAEDYVTLMGSPTINKTATLIDVRQQLNGASPTKVEDLYYARNVNPQKNLYIPMANEVPGLAEYFYSFIDEDPPQSTVEKQTIKLNISRNQKSLDLQDGRRTFVWYDVTWNRPYTQDGVLYTLLSIGDNGYQGAIKTVRGGTGTASATIGTVVKESGSWVTWMYDQNAQGTRAFVVAAMMPDGTIYLSEPLEYRF